jgi:hypothetical protein
MDPPRTYAAARTASNIKTFAAEMFDELQKTCATPPTLPEYMAALTNVGVKADVRTFRRWRKRTREGEAAIMPTNQSEGERRLSHEQCELLIGYVLVSADNRKAILPHDLNVFLRKQWGIVLPSSTLNDYMHRLGICIRLALRRSSRLLVDAQAEAAMLWKWTITVFADIKRKTPRHLLFVVDFTYDAYLKTTPKTLGMKGSPSTKVDLAVPTYTNCYVTLFNADASYYFVAMYTYNPAFLTDRSPTPRRVAQMKTLEDALVKYDIWGDSIVYQGRPGNTKKYCRESPEIVEGFFDFADLPKNAVVMHDGSGAFSPKGVSILARRGFTDVQFIPVVHQFQSPCDNSNNGAAKADWRAHRHDMSEVESCVFLMDRLIADGIKNGARYFDRNLYDLTEEGAKRLVSGKQRSGDAERKYNYRLYMGLDGRGGQNNVPKELRDSLDRRVYA